MEKPTLRMEQIVKRFPCSALKEVILSLPWRSNCTSRKRCGKTTLMMYLRLRERILGKSLLMKSQSKSMYNGCCEIRNYIRSQEMVHYQRFLC